MVNRVDSPGGLVGIDEVSHLLQCSPRHVRRLAEAGQMPQPLRVGGLVRWRRSEIEDWISAGCPGASKGGVR
jgi:excisionase family DNA binding protein